MSGPILTRYGRTHTDFGPGFYTTTLLRQAHTWAAQIAATRPGTRPGAVVELRISRDDLAGLESLAFVRGDFHADDFWSLVHYCRNGAADHGRVIQSYTSCRRLPLKSTSSLAPRNARICSKLNSAGFHMLTINPQLALSLQAHPALDKNLTLRGLVPQQRLVQEVLLSPTVARSLLGYRTTRQH